MADFEKALAEANKKLEKLQAEYDKLTKKNGELQSDNVKLTEKSQGLENENAELKELLTNQAEEAKADKSSKEDGMVVFSVNKKKYGIPANFGEITVPANTKLDMQLAKFNVKDISKYPKHAEWLVENSPAVIKY